MGHIRLGNLPRSKKWTQVVELLEGGAGTPQLAAATMDASLTGFKKSFNDQGLTHSIWLLTQIIQAARRDHFTDDLRKIGLSVSDRPTLLEIVGSFTDSVDAHIRKQRARTDIGEMGQMAVTEAMTSLVGQEAQSLFGATTDDVQRAFKKYSTTKQFGTFAREFFARFTKRYLSYFLSRELSNHVGGNGRFENIEKHTEFNKALEAHCYEATRIIEEFSGGWFSKTRFELGDITPEKAAGYLSYSLKKLGDELAKGAKSNE